MKKETNPMPPMTRKSFITSLLGTPTLALSGVSLASPLPTRNNLGVVRDDLVYCQVVDYPVVCPIEFPTPSLSGKRLRNEFLRILYSAKLCDNLDFQIKDLAKSGISFDIYPHWGYPQKHNIIGHIEITEDWLRAFCRNYLIAHPAP